MFLKCVLIWLACTAAKFATAQSGTFEVDLLFPRNGTWKLTSVMPIVFAVQQPQFGYLVQLQRIRWRLLQNNNISASIHEGSATFGLNATTPGLYLATGFSEAFAGIEGLWELRWQMSFRNCSQLTSEHTELRFSSFSEDAVMHFRTNNSAPTPSLEIALSLDSCRDVDSLAFNVSGVRPVAKGLDDQLSPSCVAQGDSPTVTGSPCSITINSAASASVSAAFSYSTCRMTATTCASPPSSTKPSAAIRLKNSLIFLLAIIAIIGLMLL